MAVLAGTCSTMVITAAIADPLPVTTNSTITDWTVKGTATVRTGTVSLSPGGKPFTLTPAEGQVMVEIKPQGTNLNVSTVDAFLGLTSGSMLAVVGSGSSLTTTNYGAIVKEFNLTAGTYTFGWAYSAGDYLPYSDGVFASISGGDLNQIQLLARNGATSIVGGAPGYQTNTAILQSYGNTPWLSGSFVITADGIYKIGFGAFNGLDTALDPVLFVSAVLGTYTGEAVQFSGGGVEPTPVIPDIDTAVASYTTTQLAAGQVNPVFTGGTLNVASSGAVSTDFTVQSQGGTINTDGNTVEMTGVFSGVGGLTKAGAGTLTLTGANTYSGGTTVSGGRLAGSTTSLQGAIANNAEVEFSQSTAGTYAGAMTGTGKLIKAGTGTVTLTGANTYSGGTTVSGGRLVGSTTSLQGAIANNAEVEFSQSAAGTYAGAMTGTGQLIKTGAGNLTLTGSSNITGQASVTAGTLSVNNQLTTGGLFVRSAATLGGSGLIGGNVTVESGAKLAPGNSPGTLSVSGNVTLAAGSTFQPEIDGRSYSAAGGAGSYDRLAVTGTVTLGGTIAPTLRGITGAANNTFTPVIGDGFTVMTAAGFTGSFSSVAQPSAGLAANTRFDVLYLPTNVTLVVTPGSYGALGSSSGWTQNAINAGYGLDAVRPAAGVRSGNLQTVFNGLYGMGEGPIRTALQQISGEIHSQSLQSVIGLERDALGSVLANSCDMACSGGGSDTNNALWANFIGVNTDRAGDRLASGYSATNRGIVGGFTAINAPTFKLGWAGSAIESTLGSDIGGRSKSNLTAAYVYFHYLPAEWFTFSGAFGVTKAKISTTRTIVTTNGAVVASSDRTSRTKLGSLEASLRMAKLDVLSIWANGGVQVGYNTMNRFTEQASTQDFALTLGKVERTAGEANLGVRVELDLGTVRASVNADAVRQLRSNPAVSRSVELGNAKWNATGVAFSDRGLRIGGQISANIAQGVSIYGTYEHTDQGVGQAYNRLSSGVRLTF